MNILINQLVSSVLQLALFCAVPWLFYLARHKKLAGFGQWMGLYPVPHPPLRQAGAIFVGFLAVTVLPWLWLYHGQNLNFQGLVYDAFRQSGWSAVTLAVVLLWAVVQTSLTEELLFRGFFCKRFSALLGQRWGNLLQAALFGLVHVMALPQKTPAACLVIVLLTGGVGWALGWLSQKRARGSILYGWAVHAGVNLVSSLVVLSCFV